MRKTEDIVKILSNTLNNRTFLKELMRNMGPYHSVMIEERLSTVLCYYLATRDTKTDYTYDEIEDKYWEEVSRVPITQIYDDAIKNGVGFLTHSFSGYKKDRIIRYGLNYMESMSESEVAEVMKMREKLGKLEEILGDSRFVQQYKPTNEKQYNSNELFLCTPGTKTIYYACQRSPERFYEGPAKQEPGQEEPIVVGETKEAYILRVLTKKIQKKYPDTNSPEYLQAIETAREITKHYCSQSPAFALINMENIKNIPVSYAGYNHSMSRTLEEQINSQPINTLDMFFTTNCMDHLETNNLGDLATLPSFIPKEAIAGIIDMVDEFEMKQIFARTRGRKVGDLIDYNTCEYRGKANLEQLIGLISSKLTEEDLEEIKNKYLNIRQRAEQRPYKTIGEEQLAERKAQLKDQKQRLLLRQFGKEHIPEEGYTLEEILNKIQEQGQMSELLQKDASISKDELQYQSDLHGAEHTRRVNFFAITIMNLENITGKDRDIILEIVKNHDIGRENDYEDKQHGEGSVRIIEAEEGRLQGFDEEEQQLIKFVIKQHSRSTDENTQAISELPVIQRPRYSKILNLFKDADKLDRVRLDPTGMFKSEGLDASRLSFESSKKLEGVAYEAYDKLLGILDIEQEMAQVDSASNQIDVQTLFDEFERKMQIAQEERKENAKSFLQSIIGKGKEMTTLSGMERFVTAIKTKITETFTSKKNTQEEQK